MKEVIKKYDIVDYVLLFFTFAFIGWFYEVTLHIIEHHELINKGVLLGPWLPIYGYGGIIMYILTKKYQKKPILVFGLCVLIAGIIEYVSSWYLETFLHFKWWDYSQYMLNINGRVSIEILLLFGFAGVLAIYFFVPRLKKLFSQIHGKNIICIILVLLFVTDRIHSIFYPNTGNGVAKSTINQK